jgi:uncharacterized protein
MKRRNLLKILLPTGLAALGGYTGWIEPEQITIGQYNLQDRFVKFPHPGQPSGTTLKIVQISDLHIKQVDQFYRAVADRVNQLQPDVVLLTGDIVDRDYTLPILEAFLTRLDPKPAKYAILGNWEHYSAVDLNALTAVYAQFNCPLLINASVIHRHQGHTLLLTGLDDTVEGQPNLAQALAGVTPQPNHLILAHAPDQRDLFTAAEQQLLAQFQPQLILSGHTHGGQVTFLGWSPILPQGSGVYNRGWYTDRAPQLYVSRGLGGSSIRARLGAVPEIAVFDWPLLA